MRLSELSPSQMLSDPFLTLQLGLESLARNIGAEWWLWAQVGVALALGLLIDLTENRDMVKRYRSKNFRVDATYAVIDLFHISHFVVLIPAGLFLTNFLNTHASWLKIDALAALPVWGQLLVLFVFTDFCVYWYHRFQHMSPVLWQFHKTHHSQIHMTALTVFRMSILDRLVTLTVLSVPAAMMGIGYTMPLLIVTILYFHQLMVHSATGWTFGPLGRIIVSPSFHEVHHSTAPEHVDKNFGGVLAIWDHLFASTAERGEGPIHWGLIGERVPESYIGQIFVPIVGLYRLGRKELRKRRQRQGKA